MSKWLNLITNAISKIIVKSVVDSLGKIMLVFPLILQLSICLNDSKRPIAS